MKKWKVPAFMLGFLILALILRWGDLGSATNNGTTIKTKVDHWNGSVWQTTIKNGSYTEKIVSPSWLEASRKPIERQEEYQEPIYGNAPQSVFKFATTKPIVGYYTATKTIQAPPPPIYWLSSDGLLKIWVCVILVIGIWLIVAVVITSKRKNYIGMEL
ncbi:hypothetical protein E4K67_04220 [Desulfosporosinus fructosivorans]|uniref:Uncharacterized protein n=1 Tax=Desulfosporosinus fructosivorans TaxID=2018669 RepID=A0A4Z0R7B2_9FIRM|nr:hypothetical protein [Desulfosporosinus fructosivorans]TGE38700.1 hypothetical protein E4K67_04220 [Desulfosporosinus fructosivorans]